MATIFDAAAHRQWVADSLDYLKYDRNLTLYYQWCLAHKRFWSDSFADWCQMQEDLTYERITQRWRTNGRDHRENDLISKIRDVWDKVRPQEEEPTSQTQDPDLPH